MTVSSFDYLPPHSQLLLLAARADHAADAQIKSLLNQKELDWDLLIKIALGNDVLPIVYQRLKEQTGEELLQQEIKRFQEIYIANAQRSLRQVQTLLQIGKIFSQQNIAHIPIKGPIIAWQAYQDVTLRTYTDLDFLIHPQDFSRVYSVLLEWGFQPEFKLTLIQQRYLLRGDSEFKFQKRDQLVEIHWEIDEKENYYPIPQNFFWDNAQPTTFFEIEMQLLTPEATFLLSCLHGSKHIWNPMKWAVDLAFLSKKVNGSGWNKLEKWGKRWGVQKLIYLGALLANHLGGEVHPDILGHKHAYFDAFWVKNHKNIVQSWFKTQVKENYWANIEFYLSSRERLRDRLYFIFQKALVPKKADWLSLSLPRSLYILYIIYRPIRICFIFGGDLIKRRLEP